MKKTSTPTQTSTQTSGSTVDPGIVINADGSVTLKPLAADPQREQEAQDLTQSGGYLVEKKTGSSMAEGLIQLAIGYLTASDPSQTPAQQQQQGREVMLSGFTTAMNQTIEACGGTRTDPVPSGATPGYDQLPEAAAATASTVRKYPIETNNAHADPAQLEEGGQIIRNLSALDGVLGLGSAQIGLTLVPIAREVASTVSNVCQAAQPELPRSIGLKATLGPALTYNSAKAVKAAKTKARTKAVKAKTIKETTDQLNQGKAAAGSTSPPATTSKGQVG